MSLFRPAIESMSGYTPGEQPQEAGFVKLNTNENPYPPSPAVLDALREWIGPKLRLYPDPLASAVRERAARRHGVTPDRVLVGNGSDDLLTIVMRSFVDPGQAVAYATPTYSLYGVLAGIQGGVLRTAPYTREFTLPEALFAPGAAVTLVASPNSPSGTVTPIAELRRLARAVSGVLVVDEAYVDFAETDCMSLASEAENVIVLRSFSKSFALCGLRLGYAVASRALIAGMMKVKDSYNVNRLAAVAGAAALDDMGWMRSSAEKVKATRRRLTEALEGMGWFVYPSQANFVLARAPGSVSAKAVYEGLKAKKVLVRYFAQPMIDDCLRISVGTDEEIDTLLRRMKELAAG
ncbi:MAG TPA: histidinol-phosphate transaminase [Candidatus Brocadiia bacterium]|nr:histidinol-phosphate transaminase [Candidatus Brocadiia bacterium]